MHAVQQEQQPERRRLKRSAIFTKGEIIIRMDHPRLKCELQDYSDLGARLNLAEELELPVRFRLRIIKTGKIKRARTVWRTDKSVGVVFEEPSVTDRP